MSCLTVVESAPKVPFLTASTLRCRGGCYSFPRISLFTLDPNPLILIVKQRYIKYYLGMNLVYIYIYALLILEDNLWEMWSILSLPLLPDPEW